MGHICSCLCKVQTLVLIGNANVYSGLRMYLSLLIHVRKWQFHIIYNLAQFNIRSSITVVIRHKLWTEVLLCLIFYKKKSSIEVCYEKGLHYKYKTSDECRKRRD